MKCYERFEDAIGNTFSRYGKFVARHPWKFIIGIVLMNGLLGVGMLRMESDIDVSRVYAPMNSQAIKDEEKVQNIFPDRSGDSFYGYQAVLTPLSATILFKPNNGTILDLNFLTKAHDLVNQIRGVVADHEGTPIKLEDVCAKNRNSCVITDIFFTPEFHAAVNSSSVTYPDFLRSSGEPVDLVAIVAGAEVTSGTLTKATYMSVKFSMRSDTDDVIEKARTWKDKFIDFMKDFSSDTFDFAFTHDDSLSEELNANIGGDIGLFSVTFTLMITYACVATYSASNDCVGNRMFLGFAGVMAAGLGIVASFGLVSACGMKFVSIVGNAPFLLLGIGVDAMFILLSGLADASYDVTTGERIGQMMRTSGVAITITSFTDILAFAAGATSTFKSVRNFCVFTGVAVLFAYINQMTFFTACLAANEDRIKSKRHFIVCCREARSKDDMKKDSASSTSVFCCSGRPPRARKDIESIFEMLPRKYLPKIVLQLPVKIIVLIVFAAYVGLSAWGITGLEQGLVIRDLVAEDSYFYKFTEWSDENFEERLPISFVIDSRVDYSDSTIQAKVQGILNRAENDEFISKNSKISWLDQYVNSPHFVNTTKAAFVQSLQNNFLKDPRFARFENDVKIEGGDIVASRVYVFTTTIINSQDNGQMMLNMRDVASETPSPLSVTAYAPAFVIYEQYVSILPQTMQTLGVSLAAVFVITAIFMPHPLLLVYIVVTMAMIISGIIGFMHHWGLTLSSVTMIHLIMSVGFSVDFTAHICHAFMSANGKDRNERAGIALQTSGGPILNGAISSIIGIVMLSIAKSYIFKSFFQVMLLVVLFGLGHAIFFLPTVLSFIGPSKSSPKDYKKRKPSLNGHENESFYRVSSPSSRGNIRSSWVGGENGQQHTRKATPVANGHTELGNMPLKDTINETLHSDKNLTVYYNGKSLTTVESAK